MCPCCRFLDQDSERIRRQAPKSRWAAKKRRWSGLVASKALMALNALDGLFPLRRRLWCLLLVRCYRLTGNVFLLGVAAPAVLPVPFSTGFASGLTWDSKVGTVFALARFLSDFAQFPVVLPPVLLPFRFLTSGSLVFLALFGCLRKFWGKGCLCLCGGVPLFLENPARLFLRSCLLGLGLSVGIF